MDLPALKRRVADLDKILQPIANKPLVIQDPDGFSKISFKNLFDPKVLQSVAEVVEGLAAEYLSQEETVRAEIRELFHTYRSFSWASPFRGEARTAAELRRRLILFSMRDQADDPRDAVGEVWALRETAQRRGLPFDAISAEIAEISSRVARSSMGSTRDLLLGKRHY
jgi:hypothetical protein